MVRFPSDVLYAREVDLDLPRVARGGKPACRSILPAAPRLVAVVAARCIESEKPRKIAREHGITRVRVAQVMAGELDRGGRCAPLIDPDVSWTQTSR